MEKSYIMFKSKMYFKIHLELCKRLKNKEKRKVTFKYYSCTNGQNVQEETSISTIQIH